MLDLLKELKEFNQSSMASNGFGRALMISHAECRQGSNTTLGMGSTEGLLA